MKSLSKILNGFTTTTLTLYKKNKIKPAFLLIYLQDQQYSSGRYWVSSIDTDLRKDNEISVYCKKCGKTKIIKIKKTYY